MKVIDIELEKQHTYQGKGSELTQLLKLFLPLNSVVVKKYQ